MHSKELMYTKGPKIRWNKNKKSTWRMGWY